MPEAKTDRSLKRKTDLNWLRLRISKCRRRNGSSSVSTQSDVSLRALKRERAKCQCSTEGIPYEICGRCFRAGRYYLKLPWEMRQATRCRLCTQCMAEKRRRKRTAARSRPATQCRVDGCRRPADPIRYTICGYHYRRLPQTRRSNQRYKKHRAAVHKRIIKGRPHKKGEAAVASPPFRFAVRGYAPLRRRSEGKRSRTAYQA